MKQLVREVVELALEEQAAARAERLLRQVVAAEEAQEEVGDVGLPP